MLRIIIEKVPHGKESLKHVICVGMIANDGTGTQDSGNYQYVLSEQGRDAPWHMGEVDGFPRKEQNAWQLLAMCLKDVP